MMKLSIIIPTYNRSQSLGATLQALQRQTLAATDFEIIVVDDGSRPEEQKAIQKLSSQFNFKLLQKANGGQASARNLGAAHATGKYLYFLDDDIIPETDTLNQILLTHAEQGPGVVVLGAWPFPEEERHDPFIWFLERVTHYDLYADRDKYPGGAPPLPPLNGNSSIARELFEKSGGYDESFRRYGGEDMELGYRLLKSGVRFVYNPLAIGYHNHSKDFTRHCQDQVDAGRALAHIYHLHPEIKGPKKIDIITDRLATLPWPKKIFRIIWLATSTCPALLRLPRLLLKFGGRFYALRRLLFQFYRWVAFYHYGLGIEEGVQMCWSSSPKKSDSTNS